MKCFRQFITASFTFLLCLFAASSVFAQSQSDSQNRRGRLSEIKNKQRIFVEVSNKTTKEEIEEFFKDEGGFEIVQNPKDAELIYMASFQAESRPVNKTVENLAFLPRLSSGEGSNNNERISRADSNRSDYDYRKKTQAFVYYNEPNGERVTVWSKETLLVENSREPGANLQYFRKSGDEFLLAKNFLKKLKDAN